MNFFENYDHKALLEFLEMEKDESPKILIITGPYNSGKTTLRRLVESYNNYPVWMVQDPISLRNTTPPESRSVMTHRFSVRGYSHQSGNLEDVCKACFSIMKRERIFYSRRKEKEIFFGNQTIIELEEEMELSEFFQRKDILILTTKKVEKREDNFKILDNEFKLWLSAWRIFYNLTPIVFQLLLLKKYKLTLLNSLPKDVFRLLISDIISQPFNKSHGKDFHVTMIN